MLKTVQTGIFYTYDLTVFNIKISDFRILILLNKVLFSPIPLEAYFKAITNYLCGHQLILRIIRVRITLRKYSKIQLYGRNFETNKGKNSIVYMKSVLNSVKVHANIVMDLLKPIFYTEIFQTTLLTDEHTQNWTCLCSHPNLKTIT